jgi:broad specificity phosphatase PhoE
LFQKRIDLGTVTATVHLVRHAAHADLGQRLSGRSPSVPLSDRGAAQAARIALRLARETIAAIHSSPLARARSTAAAIAARLGLGVEVAAALNEVNFGRWTGRRFDDLQGDPSWARWNERRASACPPGGETMAEVQARAVSHVERVAAAHPGSGVVLVSHCDTIRAVIAHYLGLSLDNLLRFDIDPASTSSLLVGPWGARILSLNEKVSE